MEEKDVKIIKTRDVKHDIKVLDKSAEMAKSLKKEMIRTKDQVQNLMDDGQVSPSEYAEDKLQYAAEDTAQEAGHQAKKAVQKTKEKVEDRIERRRENKTQNNTGKKTSRESGRRSRRRTERNTGNINRRTGQRPAERSQEKNTSAGSGKVKSGVSQRIERRVKPGVDRRKPVGRSKDRNARGPGTSTGSSPRREYGVRQHQAKVRSTKSWKQTVKKPDEVRKNIKQTAKSSDNASFKTVKGSIKGTGRTIKTAEQTSKTIKTTKAAAKTTRATIAAAPKTVRVATSLARKAAAISYNGAVATSKAAISSVKAIMAAVKNLITTIAAGGLVAFFAVLLICMVGMLVGSVFGIFFSSEDTGSQKTMRTVVQDINNEYLSQIDAIKSSYTYDEVEMTGSTAVWREVLAIYTVKTTTDEENPQEVASIDDNKISILTSIFWEMNTISSRTETKTVTEIVETDDGNGNIVEEEVEVEKTFLYITVSHKTADDMAVQYAFTEDQKQKLAELLDEKNRSMWSSVLYGIRAGESDIVAVALSQVGNVGGEPYWSWYGFDNRVEWCAIFVSWCANECGYIDDGIIPRFAGCGNGVQWFKSREQWIDGSQEPVPGMIIFYDWDDPDGDNGPQDGTADHTGIVQKVENGIVYVIEGNTTDDSCRIKQRPVGWYEILGYGVPAY